jgi:hypothetical protein
VRRWLRVLHEIVALSFDEVKAQCLSDTVWWLNANFIILGIEGILNMLNGEACQKLNWLHDMVAFCDAAALEDVPKDVHRLAGEIVWRW